MEDDALLEHFSAVAGSVDVLTLVCNFPMLTGVDISSTLVGRLAGECPNVVGIKDTGKEFSSYYAETCVLCPA